MGELMNKKDIINAIITIIFIIFAVWLSLTLLIHAKNISKQKGGNPVNSTPTQIIEEFNPDPAEGE